MEEAGKLLLQCLHSHSPTNRKLDWLNNVEPHPSLPPPSFLDVPFLGPQADPSHTKGRRFLFSTRQVWMAALLVCDSGWWVGWTVHRGGMVEGAAG